MEMSTTQTKLYREIGPAEPAMQTIEFQTESTLHIDNVALLNDSLTC